MARAWSRWWIVSAALLSGSTTGCAEPPGRASADIIGGEVTSDYPAVGELLVEGSGVCTGTLVHPQAVLTAAHCLHEDDPGWTFALDLADERREVAVSVAHPHPDYGDDLIQADVAVLILDEPVSQVLPRPMMREAGVVVGETVVVVGYGAYDGQGYFDGFKRSGLATLRQVDEGWLHLEREEGQAQPCVGDSGGPYLDEASGAIAGVHARGNCHVGGTSARAVAMWTWVDWVDGVFATHLPPPDAP